MATTTTVAGPTSMVAVRWEEAFRGIAGAAILSTMVPDVARLQLLRRASFDEARSYALNPLSHHSFSWASFFAR